MLLLSLLSSSRVTVLGVVLSIVVGHATHVSAVTGLSQCVQQYEVPQIRYPPPPMLQTTTTASATSSSSSSPSSPSSSIRSSTSSGKSNQRNDIPLSFDTDPGTSRSSSSSSWQPPGDNFLWSPWHVCYSTRKTYLTLLNMQAIHYPILPQSSQWPRGSAMDIVSWSTYPDEPDNDAITTVFGYFRPVAKNSSTITNTTTQTQYWPATWRFTSTGILSNTTNLWSILSYGTDTNGVAYRVDYETGYHTEGTSATNGRPCININSRSDAGPSQATMTEIINGLKHVGRENNDQDFVDLVDDLGKMKTDGRRKNDDGVDGGDNLVCDQDCVDNRDLKPVKKRKRGGEEELQAEWWI